MRRLPGSRRSSGHLIRRNDGSGLRQAWSRRIDLDCFVGSFVAQGPPEVAPRCHLDVGQRTPRISGHQVDGQRNRGTSWLPAIS